MCASSAITAYSKMENSISQGDSEVIRSGVNTFQLLARSSIAAEARCRIHSRNVKSIK